MMHILIAQCENCRNLLIPLFFRSSAVTLYRHHEEASNKEFAKMNVKPPDDKNVISTYRITIDLLGLHAQSIARVSSVVDLVFSIYEYSNGSFKPLCESCIIENWNIFEKNEATGIRFQFGDFSTNDIQAFDSDRTAMGKVKKG